MGKKLIEHKEGVEIQDGFTKLDPQDLSTYPQDTECNYVNVDLLLADGRVVTGYLGAWCPAYYEDEADIQKARVDLTYADNPTYIEWGDVLAWKYIKQPAEFGAVGPRTEIPYELLPKE